MKIQIGFLVTLMAFYANAVQAANMSLVYTGAGEVAEDGAVLVQNGDVVTFDIVADFSGPGEITIGGFFDVIFDSSLIELDDYFYTFAACGGDPCQLPQPQDIGGRLESFGFGVFGGLTGPTAVASVSFFYVGEGNGSDTVISTDASALGGFISELDFVTELPVDFYGVTLRQVPVPAAVWLLLGALGALRLTRRR
ncbi:MAG: hypothetical protein AB8G17_18860 [Gammaproteobacteria bacterium]